MHACLALVCQVLTRYDHGLIVQLVSKRVASKCIRGRSSAITKRRASLSQAMIFTGCCCRPRLWLILLNVFFFYRAYSASSDNSSSSGSGGTTTYGEDSGSSSAMGPASSARIPLYFMLMSSDNKLFQTSGSIPAVKMALEAVNKDWEMKNLSYSLQYVSFDSQVLCFTFSVTKVNCTLI